VADEDEFVHLCFSFLMFNELYVGRDSVPNNSFGDGCVH